MSSFRPTLNYREKRQFDSFQQHLQWVMSATAISAVETDAQRDKRRNRARADYRYFVQEYFPHYASAPSAAFHVNMANKCLKHARFRGVMAWFRGAAKSVHADIFIPMWLKIQQPRQYNTMVLVGKSYDSAQGLLSDLQAELQGNQKYIADFGDQMKMGSWEEGEFTTRDGCSFHAIGLGQSPRGLRDRQHRPDLIIVDDVDDDETVRNEITVDKRVEWINKALIPTMDAGRGRVLFANNIIHEKSIIAKMVEKYREINANKRSANVATATDEQRTHYHVSVVNIRDRDGKLTWPEKYTEQEVDELEQELGYAASQTEFYNNPIQEGNTFKREWFVFDKIPKLNTFEDLVAYYDGGYKKTATADSKSLCLWGILKGKYYLIKTYTGKASRMEAVEWHYDLHSWLKAQDAAARWYMEVAFMLDLLFEDFADAAVTHGYPIPIMADKRKKPDKDLRIQATSGAWERGNVIINEAEKNNHHMKALLEQYWAFRPGSKTLKDGPDASEGAMHLLQERVKNSAPPTVGVRRLKHSRFRY